MSTPETLAIVAAMTAPPSSRRESLIDKTVVSLINAGLWSKIGYLSMDMAHDGQAGLVNWKNPATVGTPVNGPTFAPDSGWSSNGTNSYIDRNIAWNAVPGNTRFSSSFGAMYYQGASASAVSGLILSGETYLATNNLTKLNSVTNTAGVTSSSSNANHFRTIVRRTLLLASVYTDSFAPQSDILSLTVAPTSSKVGGLILASTVATTDLILRAQWAGAELTETEVRTLHSIISYYYTGLYEETPSSLANLKAAILNGEPAKVLCIGDSNTEAVLVQPPKDQWPNILNTLIRQQYSLPGGDSYYMPASTVDNNLIASEWTYTGTHSMFNQVGIGYRDRLLNASATASVMFEGTGLDFFYTASQGSGNCRYQVDSATPVTFNPFDPVGLEGTRKIEIRGLASGSHTFKVYADTPLLIEGIFPYNGDEATGFQTYNAGYSGSKCYDFVTKNIAWSGLTKMVEGIQPHLVILGWGPNDWMFVPTTQRRTKAQFRQDLQNCLGIIRSAKADTDVMVLVPPETWFSGAPMPAEAWWDWRMAYFDFARDNGLSIVDIGQRMGSFVGGNPAYETGDEIHYNAAGNQVVAEQIASRIIEHVDA